jgi:hypothetical protein
MKCIEKSGKVRRERDGKAADLVNNEGFKYCPKSKWKEQKGGKKINVKKAVK